jgi:hypothetical protein
MRVLAIGLVTVGLLSTAASAGPIDFAQWLSGPWGRVDLNWQPYFGALSKNSCPSVGISKKESVGLFGEGGSMWIEPGMGGSIMLYDGGMLPHSLSYVGSDATGAIYTDGGVRRHFAQAGSDRLTEEHVPAVPGVPGVNYVRCAKKK